LQKKVYMPITLSIFDENRRCVNQTAVSLTPGRVASRPGLRYQLPQQSCRRHPATEDPMSRTPAIALLAVTLALIPHPAPAGQASLPDDHVVLISIDGLRPEFYLDASWPAPMLQQLARDGAAAEGVRTVYPSVTYPSHTTMVTGVRPARHGIYYNTPFEPSGQTGRWYWEYDGVTARSLWSAVHDAGGTTAAVNWPVTVGAPIDYNIPEVWSLEDGFGATRAVREASNPPGLFEQIEREAVGELSNADVSPDWMGRQLRSALMGAYLIETYRPTLTAIHLIAVDHFEHDDGRDSLMVRRALASADTAVGELMDAAQRAGIAEQTTFIITGDHGFFNVHSALAPNVWLAEAGLMEPERDRGDWRATFHTASASAFLHLRDPADTEAVQIARRALAEAPAELRGLFRVVERDELDRLGADPRAVLALSPMPGISMSSSARGTALRRASGGNHGFHPDYPELHTGFIAAGPAINGGLTVHRMELVDVAPTVAALLGLDLPDVDGRAYPGMLAR
jgi:hypothetical protein